VNFLVIIFWFFSWIFSKEGVRDFFEYFTPHEIFSSTLPLADWNSELPSNHYFVFSNLDHDVIEVISEKRDKRASKKVTAHWQDAVISRKGLEVHALEAEE